MKVIKTYEEFENKCVKTYENQIGSILYDLKDISIGFHKTYYEEEEDVLDSIIYSFAIKDFENKKEEINIYIDEIESFCKSIGIIVYKYFNYSTYFNVKLKCNYIILEFSFGCQSSSGFYRREINYLNDKIGIRR